MLYSSELRAYIWCSVLDLNEVSRVTKPVHHHICLQSWLTEVDLNHRHKPYQDSALTELSYPSLKFNLLAIKLSKKKPPAFEGRGLKVCGHLGNEFTRISPLRSWPLCPPLWSYLYK